MRNVIVFISFGLFVGIILSPTLSATEDEKVVKLLLCYNSPKSDYCLAEHIIKLQEQVNTQQEMLQSLNSEIARLKKKQIKDHKKIVVLEKQVQRLQESLQNVKAEITRLEKHFKFEMAELEKHFKSEMARLEEQLGKDQKRIQALETVVTKQTNLIDTLQTMLQSALERISLLETRLYRYTDNNDGTVTDNRTGLIWLKNANCFDRQLWKTAKKKVAELASGQCGLRDSSGAGEWRLPNKEEWEAMMDYKYRKLTLSNAMGDNQWKEGDAFLGVQFSKYWSSTSYTERKKSFPWYADIYNGNVNFDKKNTKHYVWPIKGEQFISK